MWKKGISENSIRKLLKFAQQKTFRINQLEGRAKEKALDWLRQEESDSWSDVYSDDVLDRMKEAAPEYFQIDDINYSGFWSQGDGASWTGSVNVPLFCQQHGLENYTQFVDSGAIEDTAKINQQGHYSHEGTMSLDLYIHENYTDTPEEEQELIEASNVLEKQILEEAKDYAKKIYRELEQAYEFYTGEENLTETAEANDWVFYGDGEFAGSDESAYDMRNQMSFDFFR